MNLKKTLYSLLLIGSSACAGSNAIKPEETPLPPETALKIEDVPPIFSRNFIPKVKTAAAKPKDSQIVHSAAELEENNPDGSPTIAQKKPDDGFPTPIEEARNVSPGLPAKATEKDSKIANSQEELTQEKWVDAESVDNHSKPETKIPDSAESNVKKDETLFNEAMNEPEAGVTVKPTDEGFAIAIQKPRVEEFNPDAALKHNVQIAEAKSPGKQVTKELGKQDL